MSYIILLNSTPRSLVHGPFNMETLNLRLCSLQCLACSQDKQTRAAGTCSLIPPRWSSPVHPTRKLPYPSRLVAILRGSNQRRVGSIHLTQGASVHPRFQMKGLLLVFVHSSAVSAAVAGHLLVSAGEAFWSTEHCVAKCLAEDIRLVKFGPWWSIWCLVWYTYIMMVSDGSHGWWWWLLLLFLTSETNTSADSLRNATEASVCCSATGSILAERVFKERWAAEWLTMVDSIQLRPGW